MKLILSSWAFDNQESRNVIIENLPKPIEECVLLYIPNESATPETLNSNVYYEKMCKYGFSREKVYIFDHTNPEKSIGLTLDAIYVGGGNTFGILDKIRKSGFDKHIIDYVKKSGVTYIGNSAGAHIVTQNIEHVLMYDDNNVEMTDFTGLGLFDGILICHYTYHRKKELDTLEAQGKYKVKYLTDFDSIVFEDN